MQAGLQMIQSLAALRLSLEVTMDELTYSINRTAKALGVGRSSVYKLIKSGRLDALKIGTRTLITTASIARLTSASPQN